MVQSPHAVAWLSNIEISPDVIESFEGQERMLMLGQEFYSLAQGRSFPLSGYPVTVNSGDLFYATIQLKSATSCAAWAASKKYRQAESCGRCDMIDMN